MTVATGLGIGDQILDALGFSKDERKRVRGFVMRCYCDEAITVTIEKVLREESIDCGELKTALDTKYLHWKETPEREHLRELVDGTVRELEKLNKESTNG